MHETSTAGQSCQLFLVSQGPNIVAVHGSNFTMSKPVTHNWLAVHGNHVAYKYNSDRVCS